MYCVNNKTPVQILRRRLYVVSRIRLLQTAL
jgi:hypothetical protein